MERLGREWEDMIEQSSNNRSAEADRLRPLIGYTVRGNSRFGYAGRAVVQSSTPYSCAQGIEVPWEIPPFLKEGSVLPAGNRPIWRLLFKVIVRVAVSTELRGR